MTMRTGLTVGVAVAIGIGIWFAIANSQNDQVLVPPDEPEATSATITVAIGQEATGLGITVNPRELISDSRCPEGVQCIWAGTLEVRTAISSEVAHGEHVLTLGKPQVFGDFTVTLTEATPYPKIDTPILETSYRLVFEVKKR